MLLRVPGIGVRNVERILAARRQRRLRFADLAKLRCDMTKAQHFVTTDDWKPPAADGTTSQVRRRVTAQQLSLL